MKVIVFSLFAFFFNLCLLAQESSNAIVRDSIIKVDGYSTKQIYDGVKTWFVENAKYDSRAILQIDKEDEGILQGKVSIPVEWHSMTWWCLTGYVSSIFYIQIKEGRFRVKFYNFTHFSTVAPPAVLQKWCMGEVLDEGYPESLKSGLKPAYNHMRKRVRPLIYTNTSQWFKDMKTSVEQGSRVEEDW